MRFWLIEPRVSSIELPLMIVSPRSPESAFLTAYVNENPV